MKKLVFLIAVLFSAFAVQAQHATLNIQKPNTYIAGLNGVDTLVARATNPQWVLINAEQDEPTTQSVTVRLDTLTSAATNVAVALYGRIFTTSAWTQIGSTVNWKLTTADTTVTITNDTANRYISYKLSVTGTGASQTTKVSNLKFKLWRE
jgi:hypothetical protein